MISSNSEEENKRIWYNEIRSIEPTSDIHSVNGQARTRYIQTFPAFIDSFANNEKFLFAFYASGGVMEEWILLARRIESLNVISFVYCFHGF